jgi:hypothetical protein
MAALPARNPHYEGRRRERKRLASAQRQREDPLLQGLVHVCNQSRPWPVEFLALKATDPASDPLTGEQGILFWIETNAGGGRVTAFSRNCYLYLARETEPRVVVPMASVDDMVRRRTGRSFSECVQAQLPAAR